MMMRKCRPAFAEAVRRGLSPGRARMCVAERRNHCAALALSCGNERLVGMPVYFIHFANAAGTFEDLEGVELADDAAACEYATLDARYLMDEGFAEPSEWPAWKVEIINGSGRRLLTLTFSELAQKRNRLH